MKQFNGAKEVELDEVSCVVLSLGGLRAARRHWLRRKEDKQQQQLTIPIQQSKESEWSEMKQSKGKCEMKLN